jgi:hypothetical protein
MKRLIDSEVAKQALSDYMESLRLKMLSYSHHPEISVIDNNTCIKVSVDRSVYGVKYSGLVWDKSIRKYSVKIDVSDDTTAVNYPVFRLRQW